MTQMIYRGMRHCGTAAWRAVLRRYRGRVFTKTATGTIQAEAPMAGPVTPVADTRPGLRPTMFGMRV